MVWHEFSICEKIDQNIAQWFQVVSSAGTKLIHLLEATELNAAHKFSDIFLRQMAAQIIQVWGGAPKVDHLYYISINQNIF